MPFYIFLLYLQLFGKGRLAWCIHRFGAYLFLAGERDVVCFMQNKNDKFMKKIKFFAMVFMALSVQSALVSCGDDNPSGDGGIEQGGQTGGGSGDGGGQSAPGLSTVEQKQRLEQAANELMGLVDAADFSSVADLIDYVAENSSDGSEVDSWFDHCAGLCELSATDDLVKNVYKASNFYGQFELRNGRWTQTASNVQYLEFRFTDGSGAPCSLRLDCSGAETPVHHDSFDDEEWDYNYSSDGYYSVMTRIENTFVVPERIDVTLTQGGATLATASLGSDISISSGSGDFDYKRDRAELSLAVAVGAYGVAVDRVAFNAGRTAAFSQKLTKDGRELVTLAMEADGDLTDDDNLTGRLTSLDFNILDKVWLKGSISSIDRFARYLESAGANSRDEAAYKADLERANGLMELGLYFAGVDGPSASMRLYPFSERGYNGEEWYCEPVLVFPDGSSYSTMQSYFADGFFESVIESFKKLGDDFVRVFDQEAGA